MNEASLASWKHFVWTLKGDIINLKTITTLIITPTKMGFNTAQGCDSIGVIQFVSVFVSLILDGGKEPN